MQIAREREREKDGALVQAIIEAGSEQSRDVYPAIGLTKAKYLDSRRGPRLSGCTYYVSVIQSVSRKL